MAQSAEFKLTAAQKLAAEKEEAYKELAGAFHGLIDNLEACLDHVPEDKRKAGAVLLKKARAELAKAGPPPVPAKKKRAPRKKKSTPVIREKPSA